MTPEADSDLASILQYTAETWGEQQMETYAALIYRILGDLVRFPNLGRR